MDATSVGNVVVKEVLGGVAGEQEGGSGGWRLVRREDEGRDDTVEERAVHAQDVEGGDKENKSRG